MKKERKLFKVIFCILLVLLFLQFSRISTIYAVANTDTKIDAVLAVDVSNSMAESDKQKVSYEAMKMFVDMTSLQGDKIGIVAYTDQIIREKALLKINSDQDKQDVKAFIDQLSRGPYTDISVGLSEAIKVLENGQEAGHVPIIILLADGNNSLNSSGSQQKSDQLLKDSIAKAKSLNIPVYTIGLNADGTLNKSVLDNISNETNGKSFVTSTAETLPQILSEIFANHLKLKIVPLPGFISNGQYQEIKIQIPNENVMEANISIMSNQSVDVRLFDPAGQEHKVPSAGTYYARSKAYSLIKLSKPAQGDWTLQVRGVNKEKIDINLVFNYDLQLVIDPLAKASFNAGDKVAIKSHLDSNGQPIANADLYKNIKATLLVKDLTTLKLEEMSLNNTGTEFNGEFTVPDQHDYEVKVKAEDASFYKESLALIISASQVKPAATATPVVSVNPSPSVNPVVVELEEKKPFPWGLVLAGIALLALILALLFYLLARIKKANQGFYGQMIIEIRDEDTGDRSSPQYKKLNVYKGKIKLHQLLQLAPEFIETELIVITPSNHDSIILTNHSTCVIEKAGRVVDAAKGFELKNKDRIKVSLQNANKSIHVEYIH